jgi:hypothetical protein
MFFCYVTEAGQRSSALSKSFFRGLLEELTGEEATRLWAEEAQSGIEEHREGRAQAVQEDEVYAKAERFLQ